MEARRDILITGGTGFLGRAVIKALLCKNHKVTTTVRNRFANVPNGCNVALADICDRESIMELVARHDFIIHLAAIVGNTPCINNIETAIRTNVLGTLNILDAIKYFSIPGIYASVGNIEDRSVYAITKSTAERFVHMYNKEHNTTVMPLRIFNVYGANQHSVTGKLIINSIKKGLRGEDLVIYGDGSQLNDFIYIDDAATLIAHSVNYPIEQFKSIIPHVGTSKGTTVREAVEKIHELTGKRSKIVFKPLRVGDVQNKIVANPALLIKPNNFDFMSLLNGLTKMIHYIQAEEKI